MVTGEGADLGAGPVTIKDVAGNTSDPASVSRHQDRPHRTGHHRRPDHHRRTPAGWYKDEVTVDFTCTDNLSGVAVLPDQQGHQG